MGFTAADGPSPHGPPAPPPRREQPPQSDGRTPPPLPPRPLKSQPFSQPPPVQGPVPAWARFVAQWYNALWNVCRAFLLTAFLLALAPILHATFWIALHVPLHFPLVLRRVLWLPARVAQFLYGGLIVFLFESLPGCIYMFSGSVSGNFWERQAVVAGSGSAAVRAASAVPNAGGGTQLVRPAATRASGASSASPSAAAPTGPEATVFVSNHPCADSFLDCVPFFSLAHRRGALGSLYFLPVDTSEWDVLSRVLRVIFLAPMELDAWGIERVLALGQDCSFVAFPEATPAGDALLSVPSVGNANSSAANELLHVAPPTLSQSLLQLLLGCTTGLGGPGSGSALRVSPRLLHRVSLVEVTLAYCGSVQADLQQKHLEELAYATGSGALDPDEEDEFDKEWEEVKRVAKSEDDAAQSPADEDDGYSAETINNYASGGRITSRLPTGSLQPKYAVFCTAAPLRPVPASYDGRASPTPGVSLSRARLSLSRQRVVPSFYAFLSGNAPTSIHVLLNEHDDDYVRRRVLQLRGPYADAAGAKNGGDNAVASREAQLSSIEETMGGALVLRLSAGASVTSWLQHRFLHQEVQLSLFGVHTRFHVLPASLSASSIPVSEALESYTVPVSAVKAAGFVAAAWCWIVALTVAVRNTRAALNGTW